MSPSHSEHETTIQDAIEELDAGPQWAAGCGLCRYGLMGIETPLPTGHTIADFRLAQYRTGELTFCECPAGVAYDRLLSDRDVAHAPDRPGAYSEPLPHERIPARLVGFTFNGWQKFAAGDAEKLATREAILANFNGTADRPGIMLYGPSGSGKTGALTPLYRHRIEKGASGIWTTYSKLLSILRDMDMTDRTRTMTRYQTTGHLFIDDFGDPSASGGATDYAKDCLFQIVDYRVNHDRPMYITTNLDPARLSDVYHERIARRLDSVCVAVHLAGRRG